MTALAEAGKAARLLADRGLASGLGRPADGSRAAGDPMIACDAYGSRFLLVAPFGYNGESPDHWYAWDIDSCWILTVVGAGVFGSAEDALAEWQHAVGPAAGTALSPGTPETIARLLARCLETGPMSDMLEGSEPRDLVREYYRLRRRAHVLTGRTTAASAAATSSGDAPGPVREAFLSWYAARHDDVPGDAADAVDIILHEWGPQAYPEECSRYACSPHRIEMAARLIRDGYFPDHANAALRLLPEWTQWCIGQSGLNGDLAARSRAAALTEAAALVDEETHDPAAERNEAPFRRQELRGRARRRPVAHLPERAHPPDKQPQVPVREHLLEAGHVHVPGIKPGADHGVAVGQARAGHGDASCVERCDGQLLTGHASHPSDPAARAPPKPGSARARCPADCADFSAASSWPPCFPGDHAGFLTHPGQCAQVLYRLLTDPT